MPKIQVAILMGSKSDMPVMEEALKTLQEFGVSAEMRVLSAHRTPKETLEYVEKFHVQGGQVFICGAGVAAALAGFVASHTTLPVIGVPIDTPPLNGLDSLLSTVQMPPGVPVATVAIGKAGAKNAALLALRILGVSDKTIVKKLENYREDQKQKILNTKLS